MLDLLLKAKQNKNVFLPYLGKWIPISLLCIRSCQSATQWKLLSDPFWETSLYKMFSCAAPQWFYLTASCFFLLFCGKINWRGQQMSLFTRPWNKYLRKTWHLTLPKKSFASTKCTICHETCHPCLSDDASGQLLLNKQMLKGHWTYFVTIY